MSSIFCRLPLVTLQLSDVGPEDWAQVRPSVHRPTCAEGEILLLLAVRLL